MSDVALVFPSREFEAAVRKASDGGWSVTRRDIVVLQDVDANDPSAIVHQLAKTNPPVAAIGPDVDIKDALELVRQIDAHCPEISVVLVFTPTADLWKEALLAGARDIIDPSGTDDAIAGALIRASELTYTRRESMRTQRNDPPAVVTSGRIGAVVSPKGGSGKTVVATNLAVCLARACPGEVVLVDLDLQFGDVASSLSLTPQYTMYTATQASGSEASLLKAFLTPHSSQLLVLCAPEDPTEADDVKEGDAIRIVRELSRLFKWVIVDTGAGLDDMTIAIAEIASDLILVSSTDVPSVRGIRKESLIMDQLGVRAKRHFVLNRSDAKVGLAAKDIAASVGLQIDAEIPSSRSVPTSVNVGVPIVEHESRNPAARGIAAFAAELLADEQPDSRVAKRGRFFK